MSQFHVKFIGGCRDGETYPFRRAPQEGETLRTIIHKGVFSVYVYKWSVGFVFARYEETAKSPKE